MDERRTEALKLQGQQSVRIRELEESLLDKISAVHGAILDDDSVVNTLESIQSEATELSKEQEKTQSIMDEVYKSFDRWYANIQLKLLFCELCRLKRSLAFMSHSQHLWPPSTSAWSYFQMLAFYTNLICNFSLIWSHVFSHIRYNVLTGLINKDDSHIFST